MGVDTQRVKIELPYLGLAPLAFSFFSFIELPPSEVLRFDDLLSPLYFFLFYLGAATLTLLAFIIFTHFNPTKRFYSPVIICILPCVVGIGLCFTYGITEFGFPLQFSIGAALVGVSSALLLIKWGRAFGKLSAPTIIPTVAAMFALTYLIKLLTTPFITGTFNLIIVGSAIILSALPLDLLARSASQEKELPENMDPPKISFVFKKTWSPLIGVSLLCVIWGSTWGSSVFSTMTMSTVSDSISIADIVTFLTCCGVCILALWKQLDITQSFVLPTSVGLLVLAWLFFLFGNTVTDFLGDLFTGVASALIPLVLLVWCCKSSANQPRSTQSFIVVTHTFLALVILFSFAIALVIGAKVAELVTPICSVLLFILYASPLPSRLDAANPPPHNKPNEYAADPSITIACLETQFGLTPRESEICFCFAQGHSSKYIAEQLCITQNTVKTHVKRIYGKLGVGSKDELIDFLNELPAGSPNNIS